MMPRNEEEAREVKKICKFLEINFEPSMLEEKNWVELDGKAWGNRAVSSFYQEGDHVNPVGRWRKRILPEDLFLNETTPSSTAKIV